ncbi:MAG: hypothetical protein MJZ87_01995 [Bacteroidales bacterium]|nr:hypothetical protein [Bacteroidales bacterium]
MQNNLNILLVQFSNPIYRDEIPAFRGAIVNALQDKGADLFHNHKEEGLVYRYPLIQYKRIHQKAAIVCIGEGTEAIGQFFSACDFVVNIGDRPLELEVESIKPNKVLVQVWDSIFSYTIRKWLPFNKENYEQYTKLESLAEKYAMLERLLIGNILSFGKGVGIQYDKQVECKITEASEPMSIMHKGVKLMGFDVAFKSNVSLPDYIGLGKGVSVGNGMVKRMESNKE